MPTPNLNLPTITPSMSADVPRDMNALSEAVDRVVSEHIGTKATINQEGHVQLNDTLISSDTTQAATANAVKQINDKFKLSPPSNAVLAAGWYVNTGEELAFYKDGFGIVHVYGRVRRIDGSTSRRVTTLPVGYRPTKAVQSQIGTSITGSGYIDIDTSGNIDVWLEGTANINVLIDATFATTI